MFEAITLPILALFGSWMVFSFAFVAFITLMVFSSLEKPIGGLAVLFVALIIGHYAFDLNVFGYVKENPWKILQYAAMYVGIGVIWAIAKWYWFVTGKLNTYQEFKNKLMGKYKLAKIEDLKNANLSDYELKTAINGLQNLGATPVASDNKYKIITWMTYWPTSAIWTVLNDPLTKLFNFLYKYLSGGMQKISDKLFSNTQNELKSLEQ